MGRFGRAVAEGLAQAGCEVIAVDTDMSLVEPLRDQVAVAAQIDSVEPEAFRAIGASDVDAAVVAIGEDFAAEILAVATLKELGIKEIVARAEHASGNADPRAGRRDSHRLGRSRDGPARGARAPSHATSSITSPSPRGCR